MEKEMTANKNSNNSNYYYSKYAYNMSFIIHFYALIDHYSCEFKMGSQ